MQDASGTPKPKPTRLKIKPKPYSKLNGARKLEVHEIREVYLSQLRSGLGRTAAAQSVGLDRTTVTRYYNEHPDFLDEIRDAEAEVVDQAQIVLAEIMNNPDSTNRDRIAAADRLIKLRHNDQKTDHKIVEHRHELMAPRGDQLREVLELQRKLQERQALPPVIDVDSEEEA